MDLFNSEAVSVPWGEELFPGGGYPFKGNWLPGIAYQVGDIVAWNRSLFRCETAQTMPLPTAVGITQFNSSGAGGVVALPAGSRVDVDPVDDLIMMATVVKFPSGGGSGAHVNPNPDNTLLTGGTTWATGGLYAGSNVAISMEYRYLDAADITAGTVAVVGQDGPFTTFVMTFRNARVPEITVAPYLNPSTRFSVKVYGSAAINHASVTTNVGFADELIDMTVHEVDASYIAVAGWSVNPYAPDGDTTFAFPAVSWSDTSGTPDGNQNQVNINWPVWPANNPQDLGSGWSFHANRIDPGTGFGGDTTSVVLGQNSQASLDTSETVIIGSWANAQNTVQSVVIGDHASVSPPTPTGNAPQQSVAIGSSAEVSTGASIAIGSNPTADGNTSIAIGTAAYVTDTGDQAVAIGHWAFASADSAVAVGLADVEGQNGVGIGVCSAESDGAIAIGTAIASGASSIAIGASHVGGAVRAIGLGSIAIGSREGFGAPVAVSDDAIAIGSMALVTDSAVFHTDAIGSIAIGGSAKVDTSLNGIAIGMGALVDHANGAIAIGLDASATNDSAIAIGSGSVVNSTAFNGLAIGKNSSVDGTRAISIGETGGARSDLGIAIGYGAIVGGGLPSATPLTDAQSGIAIGQDAYAGSADTIAIGNNASASHTASSTAIAIGRDTTSAGVGAVALGYSANAAAADTIAIGGNAHPSGSFAVALGRNTVASQPGAIAIGTSSTGSAASAQAQDGIALGGQSVAKGTGSIALGWRAQITSFSADNAIAIGHFAAAAAAGAVAIGTDSSGSGAQAVSANDFVLGTSSHNVSIPGQVGFHGAAPVGQSAHPATLADVIAILAAHGLCA